MHRVYLDTSVYNRPFDDQTQPRIWLETLAFAVILQMSEQGAVQLVKSSVLEYENSRNPFVTQRDWIAQVLKPLPHSVRVNEATLRSAKRLEERGIGALDALHLAVAVGGAVEFFVTCDDRLLRRYRALEQQPLTVCLPTEFVHWVDSGGTEART